MGVPNPRKSQRVKMREEKEKKEEKFLYSF
jgi:hypothetical protein